MPNSARAGAGRRPRARRLSAPEAWLLLQGTAAATVAWVIARHVVEHPNPFFAPIAAVIGLNAALGERGRNAMRLLLGVVVGIAAGEAAIVLLGSGYGPLALATFVAMAVAHTLGGARIVIAQAAASAILTVVAADGQVGIQRLLDAGIGGGVALLFSQLLFSPEPVALLRRAEAAALADMGEGVELTARTLEGEGDELGERALSKLRQLRDRLADLGRTRDASSRVARRSAVWRAQRVPVVRENENAGHLDLLGSSCLTFTRTAVAANESERRTLAPGARDLAGALVDLAQDPGDRATRQRAADRSLEVARGVREDGTAPAASLAAAHMAMRMLAIDIMVFAGVDAQDAEDAVREGTGQFDIPTPPPTPRTPFGLHRRRPSE